MSLKFSTDLYLDPTTSCSELRTGWTPEVRESFALILRDCTSLLLEQRGFKSMPSNGEYSTCLLPSPEMVAPLVDSNFAATGILSYTTSIYATRHDLKSLDMMYVLDRGGAFNPKSTTATDPALDPALYELGVKPFFVHGDRALTDKSHRILGGFYLKYVYEIMPWEFVLATFACAVCSVCIMLHTRSIFLTFFGLMQIMLALPVAWAIYHFLGGLKSFPVCNLNAVFIVFALGADDIFVVVDHWKNARLRLPPNATTEEVAIVALPSAAYATFVTSITTSVAFFSAAVIDVPAVALFGIFCGILITVDYILCVLLLGPVLCLYDGWVNVDKMDHWLLTIDGRLRRRKKGSEEAVENSNDDNIQEEKVPYSAIASLERERTSRQSLIYHVLEGYFYFLHKVRWILLLGSIGAIIGCSFVAARLQPPQSDPRPSFLLSNNRYELHSTYTQNLVANEIIITESPLDKVQVVFGLLPVDNGFHLDSNQPGAIVYDEEFDPANSQLYLLDMCDRVFTDRILKPPKSDYNCSLQEFDAWLDGQSQSENPSNEYAQNCNEATFPVPSNVFHKCLIAFAKLTNSSEISYVEGRVKTIVINTLPVRDSFTMAAVGKVLHAVESWSDVERQKAPKGANGFFVSSFTFWFYDTFSNMSASTYKSALISMSVAALMILSTSLSGTLMIYSTISILYILVAVTASLVSLGWTLGLFESVLFAITIGLGSDFVLHFAHAYSMPPGVVCKRTRTYQALMHMGPSVLGSATTTLTTAFIMLFSRITFTQKFATLLIMTMVHSLIGSGVIFLTWCLCFGPKQSCSWSGRKSKSTATLQQTSIDREEFVQINT